LPPQFRLTLLHHPSASVTDLFGFLCVPLLFYGLRRFGRPVCAFRLFELFQHRLSFLIKVSVALLASLLNAELGVQGHPPQRVEQKLMSLRELVEMTRCGMSAHDQISMRGSEEKGKTHTCIFKMGVLGA
jgi:hypothetical protein